jgi:SAM-dependent methyltransferase
MNEQKLNEFMEKFTHDLGAVLNAALVLIGEECGLYKALAAHGPMTSVDLAKRTNTSERYVREWLSQQAAGSYVNYDQETGKFYLTEEQAFALADETSPAYIPGAFQVSLAAARAKNEIAQRFKTGTGYGWHEHHTDLFEGTERFFRPGYAAHLISSWIPSLNSINDRLKSGAKVADIGCGFGSSTILMAREYPNSIFHGFDYHAPSIESAKKRAHEAGVSDRIRFEVARAQDYPGDKYDLVTFFDSLHDMGDPVSAGRHVLSTLKADGTWMIVEPFAHDEFEKNLNPVGRIYYGASTLVCTPNSLSQEVGFALGAQAGEKRLREVALAAGFKRFRRAAETPFNLVFEAKP